MKGKDADRVILAHTLTRLNDSLVFSYPLAGHFLGVLRWPSGLGTKGSPSHKKERRVRKEASSQTVR